MDWFDDQATKEKKAAVMNVLAVMFADGKIDETEKKFLGAVCKRVGLSQEELKELLSDPGNIKFTVPESRKERIFQLLDMVFMMMIDGEIDQREMDVCITLATRMGFRPTAVSTIVEAIKKGRNRDQVKEDIEIVL